MVNNINEALNKKQCNSGAFLDVVKSFDKVCNVEIKDREKLDQQETSCNHQSQT